MNTTQTRPLRNLTRGALLLKMRSRIRNHDNAILLAMSGEGLPPTNFLNLCFRAHPGKFVRGGGSFSKRPPLQDYLERGSFSKRPPLQDGCLNRDLT